MANENLKEQSFKRTFTTVINKINAVPTKYLYLLFLLVAVVTAGLAWGSSQGLPANFTRYNNYAIFKQSFFHLIQNKDMYILYPPEYYDLYKYSPSFALWMSAFAWMPDLPGLICFNLVNVVVLLIAIRLMPLDKQRQNAFLFFILIETMISLSSSQTNVLIAGLLILGWHFLEKDKPWMGTLMIVLTFYIKLFGIVALLLCLLYPSRWKSVLATITWLIVLGLMPLLVVTPDQLLMQYKSWGRLLSADHSASFGVSLYGWWHTWFGFNADKQLFVLVGAVLQCIPLLRFSNWSKAGFRLYMLASIMIWVVIFNHKGESPTYIIAMCGVALWYFTQQQATGVNLLLLLGALVLTSFSSTDLIFPYKLAAKYVEPFAVKAVFCSLIWIKLIWDLALKQTAPSILDHELRPAIA